MPTTYLNIIEQIVDSIGSDDPDYKWVLIGSTGLMIQGVQVEPKDIDILASANAFNAICKLFKKSLIKGPEHTKTEMFESTEVEFEVDGVKIELMQDVKVCYEGNWEDRDFILEQHEIVYFHGLAIPVPFLEDSLRAYSKMGREKDLPKVKLIEARIEELKQS